MLRPRPRSRAPSEMSLKHFHVFFIATSLGLMGFGVYWSVQRALAGEPQPVFLASSTLGLVLGLGYLRWFTRHYGALK